MVVKVVNAERCRKCGKQERNRKKRSPRKCRQKEIQESEVGVLYAISTCSVLVEETPGEIVVVECCDAAERDRSLDARKTLYIEANPPSKPLNGNWPPVQCAKSFITAYRAGLSSYARAVAQE